MERSGWVKTTPPKPWGDGGLLTREYAILKDVIRQILRNKYEPTAVQHIIERYNEIIIGGTPVFTTKYYGFVIMAGVCGGLYLAWQNYLVWSARKRLNVPGEVFHYPQSVEFCSILRAYKSSLESYPFFLFSLAVGGIEYPRLSALFGFVWVAGRIIYTRSYNKGRGYGNRNGSFFMGGVYGCYLCSLCFAFKQFMPWDWRIRAD